jgi:hypothetical protein
MEMTDTQRSLPFKETCAKVFKKGITVSPGKLRRYLQDDLRKSPQKEKDKKVRFCSFFQRRNKIDYEEPPRIPNNPLLYKFNVKKFPGNYY